MRPGGASRAWHRLRAEVYARDGGECIACHTPTHFKRCTLKGCGQCFDCGHIEPLERGGTDGADNLVCLCRRCNLACGGQNLGLWLARLHHPSGHTVRTRTIPISSGRRLQAVTAGHVLKVGRPG